MCYWTGFRCLDNFNVSRDMLLYKKERTRLNYTVFKLNRVMTFPMNLKKTSASAGARHCGNHENGNNWQQIREVNKFMLTLFTDS